MLGVFDKDSHRGIDRQLPQLQPQESIPAGEMAQEHASVDMLEELSPQEAEAIAPVDRTKMHLLLILAQACFAGFEVLSRFVLTKGLSPHVFAVYRNALAFLLLCPLSFLMERNRRPPLTKAIVGRFAILGFSGVFINQLTYFTGLRYTSATFTSAMLNSTPAWTFILAVILRQEKVRLTKKDGQAKIAGTIFGIVGAVLMIVYKGPAVYHVSSTLHQASEPEQILGLGPSGKWQLGAVSLIVTCFSFAVYLTLQKPLFDVYPAPLSVAAGAAFFGSVYLAIVAMILESSFSAWRLSGAAELISAFYAGFIASGLVAGIQSWGVRIRRGGPVIVSAYQPLETMIVAILSIVFLKETLFLGSVIGALLVIVGLYLVIWGQSEDKKFTMRKLAAATTQQEPLLHENNELP